MTLLTIDTEKCRQDGFCAPVCPSDLILFDGDGHYPELVAGAENSCIGCGQCVAVCPHDAVLHSKVRLEKSPRLEKSLAINRAQAIQFLRSRRTIRQYEKRQVPRELLQDLIDVARHSPSGANRQPVRWIVIQDRDRLKKIQDATISFVRKAIHGGGLPAYMEDVLKSWEQGKEVVMRDAPSLVIATASPDVSSGMIDLTIALSYLELAAPAFGLGCCWGGFVRMAMSGVPEIKSLAGVEENCVDFFPMMVGYPIARYYRMPSRKEAKILWFEEE